MVAGIKVNGMRLFDYFRYADDPAILASNPENLQGILDRVTEVGDHKNEIDSHQ